jgi:hypothetical protein
MKQTKIKILAPTTMLVGITMTHYADLNLAGLIKPGLMFSLKAEPNHKYDPNAISVWLNGICVGYLCSEDANTDLWRKAVLDRKQVVLIDPKVKREAEGKKRYYVTIEMV